MNELKAPYNDIFNDLYTLTEGNVIIGGSLSLKLQGVITREIGDIDVNILKPDWDKYEFILNKRFRMYPGIHILNPKLGFNFEVYTCLNSNSLGEFHLFLHYVNDIYNIIEFENKPLRVLKPEFMLKDKQWILETEPELDKHRRDVESIKTWLNGK
jgi:hypothetical protein